MGAARSLTNTVAPPIVVPSGRAWACAGAPVVSCSPKRAAIPPGATGSPRVNVAFSSTPRNATVGAAGANTTSSTGIDVGPFLALLATLKVAVYDPGANAPGSATT